MPRLGSSTSPVGRASRSPSMGARRSRSPTGQTSLTGTIHEGRRLRHVLDETMNLFTSVKVVVDSMEMRRPQEWATKVREGENPRWEEDFVLQVDPRVLHDPEATVTVELWADGQKLGDRQYKLSRFQEGFNRSLCALSNSVGQIRLSVAPVQPSGLGGGGDGGMMDEGKSSSSPGRRGGRIEAVYNEKPMTLNRVPLALRQLSGKPVLSSQRKTILDFQREIGLAGRDVMTLAQFRELCQRFGIGDDDNGPTRKSPSRSPMRKANFDIGQPVEARFRGGNKWYEGKVSRVNHDGTLDITYNDGDFEQGLQPDFVRAMSKRSPTRQPQPQMQRSASNSSMLSNASGEIDRIRYLFNKEKEVTVGTIPNILRRLTGKVVTSSMRKRITEFGRKIGLGPRDPFTLDEFHQLCEEIGVFDSPSRETENNNGASASPRSQASSITGGTSPRRTFYVGQNVEAKFGGRQKFFKGRIERVNPDGTYNIAYDDGDREVAVRPHLINALDNDEFQAPALARGDPVEARFNGGRKYFSGVIKRVNANGTYDILYDDGDQERDVPAEMVRAKDSSIINKRSSPSSRKNNVFERGEEIEARFKGGNKYFGGVIKRINMDETYDILYDDGDLERAVPSDMIRRKNDTATGNVGNNNIADVFNGERSGVTPSNVSNVLRKVSGKPILSSQRRQIMDYAKRIGLGPRDRFELHEFEALCSELGLSPSSSPRLRSPMGGENKRNSEQEFAAAFERGDRIEGRFRGGQKYYPGEIVRVNMDGTYDVRYDDGDMERGVASALLKKVDVEGNDDELLSIFQSERKVTKNNVANLLRKVSGKPILSSQRQKIMTFTKRNRIGPMNTFSFQQFQDLCQELGISKQPNSSSKSPRVQDRFTDEEGENGFLRGDKVEARYRGGSKYYLGEITRVNPNGTYDIIYEDGDTERGVKGQLIRSLKAGSGFQIGQQVEARFKGGRKFYKGEITRVNAGGTYDIRYEDGDRERDVMAENIRALDGPDPQPFPPSDEEDDFLPRGRRGRTAFRDGQLVEARYRGKSKYFRGQISRVNRDGTYDILYDDGDSERGVTAELIRSLDDVDNNKNNGGDEIQIAFEQEARITVSNVSTVLRKLTGKPVVSSQRRQIMDFAKANRIGPRDAFTFEQFTDLCAEFGVTGSGGGRKSSTSGAFDRGQKVEARFKGGTKYYKGEINRVNHDGTFDILYDDGDMERGVDPINIRALSDQPARKSKSRSPRFEPSNNGFQVGQPVEARYRGKTKWYKGTIASVNRDGTYDIEYADGDFEAGVRASFIRSEGGMEGTRHGGSPRKVVHSDMEDGGDLRAMFEQESRVTVSSVSNFLRKVTGKPILSSQRRQIMDFAKRNRIGPRDTFDFAQFQDLCDDLGIRAEGGGRSGRRSQSASPRADFYSIGDGVEANYRGKGKFYKGMITRTNPDGTFDIEYEDGDRESRVRANNIRKVGTVSSMSPRATAATSTGFRRGDKIEANFKGRGKWYSGTIVSVNRDGTYSIEYADGDFEDGVEGSNVKSVGNKSSSSRSRSPRKPAYSSGEEDIVFKRGDPVEVDYKGKGKWYKGKIGSVNRDGTYAVEFDDGDFEDGVRSTRIRKVAPGRGGRSESRGSGAIENGTRVEVNFKGQGKWYKGKVVSANRDGTYSIEYDDGDFEDGVEMRNVKMLMGGGIRTSRSRSRSPRPPETASDFARGETVEANYKGQGKWYKGKIVGKNRDGTFSIEYDDGDFEDAVEGFNIKSNAANRTTSSSFRIDERVEADYKGKGKWYMGRISTVNRDGTYAVEYDDGDFEDGVPASSIKSLLTFSSDDNNDGPILQVGDQVQANFKGKGKWYDGEIVKVNRDGSYDISYVDGDFEKRVQPADVKSKYNKSKGRSPSPRRSRSASRRRDDNDETEFQVGDSVEGNFKGKGKWYKGKISRSNRDGTFDVVYDDGDSEKRVDPTNLRPLAKRRKGKGKSDLKSGARVEARFQGSQEMYPGEIVKDNRDDTFAVLFDDGDRDDFVPQADIVLLDVGRSKSSKSRGGDFKSAYQAERTVNPGNVSEVIGRALGTPLSSDQRREIFSFCKGKGLNSSDKISYGMFQRLCSHLGFSADGGGGSSSSSSSSENGDLEVSPRRRRRRRRSASPRRRRTKRTTLEKGEKVEAQFGEGTAWYTGIITRVHGDGTVDVDYDDGDREERKDPSKVRSLESERGHNQEDKIWKKMRKIAIRESSPRSSHRPPSLKEIAKEEDAKRKVKKILGRKRYDELKAAFDKYDRDGDGVLTEDEVYRTLRDMGKPCSRKQARAWMHKLDRDDSGAVDFVEFVKAYTHVSLGDDDDDESSRSSSSSSGGDGRHRRRGSRSSRSRRRRNRSESSGSSVSSSDYKVEKKLWRKEAWAVQLGKSTQDEIEDAFEDYCTVTRRGKRILPAKSIRMALGAAGKTASVSQVSEYMRVMGLKKGDAISLAEFAHAYSYMFADPERDEFGRVGSYHDKLWGGKKKDLLGFSIQGDPETIAALAAQVFRTGEWTGTRREHEALLRKLSLGRDSEQVRLLKTLIKEFEKVDEEETGEIDSHAVESLLRAAGRPTDVLKSTLDDFVKIRPRTSLPEILAAFGFAFENISSAPTVASAFAMLRLHTSPADARVVGETALEYINKVIARPDDARLWQIPVRDEYFRAKIGRHRGGIELMHAIGFEPSKFSAKRTKSTKENLSAGFVQILSLQGTLDKHGRSMVQGVPKDTLGTLALRRHEVEQELRTLDGGTITIGEAVRLLQQECTLVELRQAIELGQSMVNKILKDTKDSRLWRIRGANQRYLDRIGRWNYGSKLMSAIGFELQKDANLYILRGTETSASDNTSFKFPELSKETEQMLWRRKADLEAALRALEVSIVTGKTNIVESKRQDNNVQLNKPKTKAQIESEKLTHRMEQRQSQLEVERLMKGKTATEQLQMKMVRQAFNELDMNKDGWISAEDLKHAFRAKGRDASNKAIETWIKERDIDQDGVVSLAEFASSFAHVVPKVRSTTLAEMHGEDSENSHRQRTLDDKFVLGTGLDSKIEPASNSCKAFGLLKLFNKVDRVYAICEAAVSLTEKALQGFEKSTSLKKGSIMPYHLKSVDALRSIGATKGTRELMKALGWSVDETRGDYFLDPRLRNKLGERIREVQIHSKTLDYPGVADARAVGGAVGDLGRSVSTKANNPESWLIAIETFMRYLDNINRDSKIVKYRTINVQNDNFRRKIGRIDGGIELFLAVGFQETEEGTLFLSEDADMRIIQARLLELQSGLPILRPNAKEAKARRSSRSSSIGGPTSKLDEKKESKLQPPKPEAKENGEFATKRIETLRIKELEAQVHILKDKLKTQQHQQQVKKSSNEDFSKTMSDFYKSDKYVEDLLRLNAGKAATHGVKRNISKARTKSVSSDVSSTVAYRTMRGATVLPVTTDEGFQYGQFILVGVPGQNQEARFVVGLGDISLILDCGLNFDHEDGEQIFATKPTRSEIQKFRKREVFTFIQKDIIESIISKAVHFGEKTVRSKEMQAAFEMRPLPKPVYSQIKVLDENLANLAPSLDGKHELSRKMIAVLPSLNQLTIVGRQGTLIRYQENMEIGELRHIFEMIDLDGDGKIEKSEIINAARANSRISAVLSAESLARSDDGKELTFPQVFRAISEDVRAELTWEDFVGFFNPSAQAASQQRQTKDWWNRQTKWRSEEWARDLTDQDVANLHVAFSLFDTDSDGKISLQEWSVACVHMDGYLSKEELEFVRGRLGKRGGVRFSEFVQMRLMLARRRPFPSTALPMLFRGNGLLDIVRNELRRVFLSLKKEKDEGTVSRVALVRELFRDPQIASILPIQLGNNLTLEHCLRHLAANSEKSNVFWSDLAGTISPTMHDAATLQLFGQKNHPGRQRLVALDKHTEHQHEHRSIHEIAVDSALNRMFVLFVDGELQVLDEEGKQIAKMQLLDKTSPARSALFSGQLQSSSILKFDELSSILICDTSMVDQQVSFYDSLSLSMLRQVKLRFHAEDESIVTCTFASKWNVLICTLVSEVAKVQIFCARSGHAIALLPGHEHDSSTPRSLFVPEAGFLVTCGARGPLRFWDLSEQLAWFLRVDDGSIHDTFWRVCDQLRNRACLVEDGSRPARIVAKTGLAQVTVRFEDELGGVEHNVDASRVYMRSSTQKYTLVPGTEVEIFARKLVFVTISRVHDDGTIDVFVDHTGEAWTGISRQQFAMDQIHEGDQVEIPIPSNHTDIGPLFEALDENGDGFVSMQEFQELLVERLKLDIGFEDAERVFKVFDLNQDGQVSLRELSSGLQSEDFFSQQMKPTMRKLGSRKVVEIPSRHGLVTSMAFLTCSGLLAIATSGGMIDFFDPTAMPHRLTHPMYLEQMPGVMAETTKTNQPYQHVMQMNCEASIAHIMSGMFQFSYEVSDAHFTVDKTIMDQALRADARYESEGRVDALVRGFCYVLEDGQVLCAETDGFHEPFVLLDNPLFFLSVGPMTHKAGWESSTDDMRMIYENRHQVARIFYFLSRQLSGSQELKSVVKTRGIGLLELDSMRRSLERPFVEVFPFYRDGDGPEQTITTSTTTSSTHVGSEEELANHIGVVTRRISEESFEVAYDYNKTLVKVPGFMLNHYGQSKKDIAVGDRVKVSKELLAPSSALGPLSSSSNRDMFVRREKDGLEFLFAVCSNADGTMGLKAFSISRTSVEVPAIHFDDVLSKEDIVKACEAQRTFLAMGLQRLRISSVSIAQQMKLAKAYENSLLQEVGSLLRDASLDLTKQDADIKSKLEQSFKIALRLPYRWGSRYRALLQEAANVFDAVANGARAEVSRVVACIRSRLNSEHNDRVMMFGLRLGLGQNLAVFEKALSEKDSRKFVTLEELLEVVVTLHAENLAPEEFYELLRLVHYVRPTTMSPDELYAICKANVGTNLDKAAFIRLTSRVDPFWSIMDELKSMGGGGIINDNNNVGDDETKMEEVGLTSLAQLALSSTCMEKMQSCHQALEELVSLLRSRAFHLITEGAESALWKLRASGQADTDSNVLISEMFQLAWDSVGFVDVSWIQNQARPMSYRIYEHGRVDAQSLPGRFVYQGKGWHSAESSSGSIPLMVHVISEDKLNRVQVDNGEPFETHLERELAMYRLLEGEHITPALIENVQFVSSLKVEGEFGEDRRVTMQELQGWKTLREIFDEHGFMGSRDKLVLLRWWATQLLHILIKLHRKGILLRGPRPRNVLVSPCGRYVQLANLATAGLLAVEGESEGEMVVGPDLTESVSQYERGYDPPNDRVETREYDIWCLGCLLLEAVTGHPPLVLHEEDVNSGHGGEDILFDSLKVSKATRKRFSRICLGPRGELQISKSDDELGAFSYAIDHLSFSCLFEADEKSISSYILDVISLCLQVDPAKRPLPADLLELPIFMFTPYDVDSIEAGGVELLTSGGVKYNVEERIAAPLRVLEQQMETAKSSASDFGNFDPRLLLDVIETVVQCCCCLPAHETILASDPDIPTICDEVIGVDALQMVVKLSLWFYSSDLGKTTGRGSSGLGFVEGDPDESLGVRILRRVVHAFQTIAAEFGKYEHRAPIAKHVASLLHSVISLYVGSDGELAQHEGGQVTSTPRRSHWTPELETIVAPLMRQVVSDEGGGNPRYLPIREFIGSCSRDLQNRVNDIPSENEASSSITQFSRSASYCANLLTLGSSMAQLCSVKRNSRTRFVAARQVLGILCSNALEHLQGCVDLDVAKKVAVLIGDSDNTLSLLALESAQVLLDGLPSMFPASGGADANGKYLIQLRRQLCKDFTSVPSVSSLVQCILGAHDKKRQFAFQVLSSAVEVGPEMTGSWGPCDVFPALRTLVKKRKDDLAVKLCRKITQRGDQVLIGLLSASPAFVQYLSDAHEISLPYADMFLGDGDVETMLEALLDAIKEADTVDEVEFILPRVRIAVTHDLNVLEDGEDHDQSSLRRQKTLLIKILNHVWHHWFSGFWDSAKADGKMAERRLPLLHDIYCISRAVLIHGKNESLLFESGGLNVLLRAACDYPFDPFSTRRMYFELQAEVMIHLGVECVSNERLLHHMIYDMEFTIVDCFSNFIRNAVTLVQTCVQSGHERHMALLSVWKRIREANRQVWEALISTRSAAVHGQIIKSGLIEFIVRDMLCDKTRIQPESHQHSLQKALGQLNGGYILREDAICFAQTIVRYRHFSASVIAEVVNIFKRGSVIALERDRIWQSQNRRDMRSVTTLMQSLSLLENEEMISLLRSDAQIPDQLLPAINGLNKHSNERLSQEMWDEWEAQVTNKRASSGPLVFETTKAKEIHQPTNPISPRAIIKESKSTKLVKSPGRVIETPHSITAEEVVDKLGDSIVDAYSYFEKYGTFSKKKNERFMGTLEMSRLLGDMGLSQLRPEARKLFQTRNRINVLDFCTFFDAHIRPKQQQQQRGEESQHTGFEESSLVEKIFRRFDVNKDGYISLEEMQVALGAAAGCRAIMLDEVKSLGRAESIRIEKGRKFNLAEFSSLYKSWKEQQQRLSLEANHGDGEASRIRDAFEAHSNGAYFIHGLGPLQSFLADCVVQNETVPSLNELDEWLVSKFGLDHVTKGVFDFDQCLETITWINTKETTRKTTKKQRQKKSKKKSNKVEEIANSNLARGTRLAPQLEKQPVVLRQSSDESESRATGYTFDQAASTLSDDLREALGEKVQGLWRAFCRFGGNRSGAIRFVDIRTYFNEMGRTNVPDSELYQWIKQRDTKGLGHVTFSDFATYYLNQ